MFWKLSSLSACSPVESILDKENYKLEELLDEDEIIQECKALNGRLINFLRDRAQVEHLLRYIVEEPAEDADSKRVFKFPFIACEVFACEINVILKSLVEDEELMNLLFSFLEPDHPHSSLLAGYFSKVVICLMLHETVALMNYIKAHQHVFRQLVDLIGITSVMEVIIRLVGADDHMYSNFADLVQWLADSNLLEMIVDKLNPSNPPEVHANAAETLCAITRNSPSPLATKISSSSFVARIFSHALEDSQSKSGLVHSLSVCISLLDPRRSATASPFHSLRSQHMYEPPIPVNSETINAMLPKLHNLLMLLNVLLDEMVLPTTYGELRPPLGKYRLKIVEFIAVLLKTSSEDADKELISSGTIQRVLDLFFEYPYNNALHHHVESIIVSCLEGESDAIAHHLLQECDLIGKILQTDKCPVLSGEGSQPCLPVSGKNPPRLGNIGHITRISNKLVQLGNTCSRFQACLQENGNWSQWQCTVLQERNAVENVYRWACGRPTALQDRARDSDEDDIHDRDYDVEALANNLSQAFRYNIYENEDAEDVYFNDESAEVVISSLRLGEDQGSNLFTNSNWFAFQDDRTENAQAGTCTSPDEMMDDINLNGTANGGNSSSDDEVVVGEDEELIESKDTSNATSSSCTNGFPGNASESMGILQFETQTNGVLFGERPIPEWVSWGDSSNLPMGGSSNNPFIDDEISDSNLCSQKALNEEVKTAIPSPTSGKATLPYGSSTSGSSPEGSVRRDSSQQAAAVPSLFEDDVEFVGVELEGTEKAMEQALKEGIVGEAGPLKKNLQKVPEKENSGDGGAETTEFNDSNYWRVDQEVAVQE